MYLSNSVKHKDYPLKENVVRTSVSGCTILEEKGNDLVFTKLNTFDMGGYYPPRLLNMVVANLSKARTLGYI